VYEHLAAEWGRTRPFPLQTITPAILGVAAPRGADLVHFGERSYARFCRAFEHAATREILRHDPAEVTVLANDVSEGPDFALLAARGYRLFTIYHVDVVAYVTALYGRGWLAPETTVRWARRLRRVLPDMAALVWEKQAASVRASCGLVMPSEGMRDVLRRCYPECPPEKIHVLPWGIWNAEESGDAEALRREYGVPRQAHVLLTLSRISPEKGQDRLLRALAEWERRPDFPQRPLWLFICGEAAFMRGRQFLGELRALAARLRRTRVVFPGYVSGSRKQAFFSLADLYVFPSRHESYGLTLLEALAAGVPAVAVDTAGARSVMRAEFGALVAPADLLPAIGRLLAGEAERRRMGRAAKAFAASQHFADRAAALARILCA
jgi:glycosyltransferase involved in cell wall biosynthesis